MKTSGLGNFTRKLFQHPKNRSLYTYTNSFKNGKIRNSTQLIVHGQYTFDIKIDKESIFLKNHRLISVIHKNIKTLSKILTSKCVYV